MSCDAPCSLVGDAPLTLWRGRGSRREGQLKLSVCVCECTKLLKTPVSEGSQSRGPWSEKMTLAWAGIGSARCCAGAVLQQDHLWHGKHFPCGNLKLLGKTTGSLLLFFNLLIFYGVCTPGTSGTAVPEALKCFGAGGAWAASPNWQVAVDALAWRDSCCEEGLCCLSCGSAGSFMSGCVRSPKLPQLGFKVCLQAAFALESQAIISLSTKYL